MVKLRMTLGRQLLLRRLEGRTQAGVARIVGCSQQLVSRLATGGSTDSYAIRLAFSRRLQIPLDAWERPPDDDYHPRSTGPVTVDVDAANDAA